MSRPQMRALQTTLLSACMYGLGSGVIGGAAVFLVNRTEALVLPFRLNSLLPARTLFSMLGRPPPTQATRGIGYIDCFVGLVYSGVIGIARGAIAWYGIRGPIADFMFMSVRLVVGQSVIRGLGIDTPLIWKWPICDQVFDLFHKAIYAVITGFFVDRWVV